MIWFACAAVAAAVLCLECERYALRHDKPQALLGAALVALALAGAWWACGSVAR